ncbi:MAG: hypothetical protein WB297_09505 [Actinomycetota bacterium]
MPLMLVILASILVGVVVYVGSVRGPRAPSATGFGDTGDETVEPVEPGTPPPGYTYLQVSTQGPGLRDRLQGLIGVILLIGVAAAALAFALYELGHLINRTIEAFLD